MINKIKKLCSGSFIRFAIVGVLNTLIGTAVMFLSYNLLHTGYWLSSALDYIIGSIFSYFANKYFTFKSKKKSVKEIILFIVNIVVCYALAYGISKPAMNYVLTKMNTGWSVSTTEQLAMLFGMGLFVIFNYFGQRIFVFKEPSHKTSDEIA